ncbi:MAG: hypothetical protein FWF57_05230 [Defluviitaleaceae bacterium]|nr:hypothetical protein [Defluviitaleaceae bacterium]
MYRRDNRGLIAIETLITFVGFLMFTGVIISWVNLASVQLRIHHALTQSALETSFYAHALEVIGITGAMRFENRLDGSLEEIADMLSGISDVQSGTEDLVNTIPGSGSSQLEVVNWVDSALEFKDLIELTASDMANSTQSLIEIYKRFKDKPAAILLSLLGSAANEAAIVGMSAAFGNFIAPMFFWRYMEVDGWLNGLEYLERMPVITESISFATWQWSPGTILGNSGATIVGGIDGVRYRPRTMIFVGQNSDEMQITIDYNISFAPFFIVPESRWLTTQASQTVVTRAWVGDGSKFE